MAYSAATTRPPQNRIRLEPFVEMTLNVEATGLCLRIAENVFDRDVADIVVSGGEALDFLVWSVLFGAILRSCRCRNSEIKVRLAGGGIREPSPTTLRQVSGKKSAKPRR